MCRNAVGKKEYVLTPLSRLKGQSLLAGQGYMGIIVSLLEPQPAIHPDRRDIIRIRRGGHAQHRNVSGHHLPDAV